MRDASAARRYERALSLRRRARRLGAILGRLGGVLEATHARPRLVLAAHPLQDGSCDAFWIAGGRLVDWGALPTDRDELHQRTSAAVLRGGRAGELGAHVPPDEIDEVRIVATYLASHPQTAQLALDPALDAGALESFAYGETSLTVRTAARRSPPELPVLRP